MIVAVLVLEIHLPGARSLKDKRRVIRRLIDRIHQRFRVSILESDHHDLHQRSELAIAVVHRDGKHLQQLLDGIRKLLDLESEAEVISWSPSILQEVG